MTFDQVPFPADVMIPAEDALAALGLTGPVELHARRFARSGGRVGMPAVFAGGRWLVSRDALKVVQARRAPLDE